MSRRPLFVGVRIIVALTSVLISIVPGVEAASMRAQQTTCASGGAFPSVVFDFGSTPRRSAFDGRNGMRALVSPALDGALSSVPYPTTLGAVKVDGIAIPVRSSVGIGYTHRRGTDVLWRVARGAAGDLYVEVFTRDGALVPQRITTTSVGGNGCALSNASTSFYISLGGSPGPGGGAPGTTGCQPAPAVTSALPTVTASRLGTALVRFQVSPPTVPTATTTTTTPPTSCQVTYSDFVIDGRLVVSQDDAALVVRDLLQKLRFDAAAITRQIGIDGVPVDYDPTVIEGDALVSQWSGRLSVPLSAIDEDRLLEWRDIAISVINEMRRTALTLAEIDLNAAMRVADRARKAALENAPRMADLQREAFAAGEPSELLSLAKDLAEMDASVKQAGEYIEKALPIIAKLKALNIRGTSGLIGLVEAAPEVLGHFGKFADLMEKFEEIKPILELANTSGTDIQRVTVAFNAQVTIVALLAAKGGYTPLLAYWGPVIEKINTNLAIVVSALTKKNQDLLRSGIFKNPASINWQLFEGGYPMYVYLTQIMLTGSGPLPPMTSAVETYLRSKDDELLQARNSFGFAADTSLPSGRDPLGRWLIDHRADVWRFFYGSVPPPR
jgi:hypothetical protein